MKFELHRAHHLAISAPELTKFQGLLFQRTSPPKINGFVKLRNKTKKKPVDAESQPQVVIQILLPVRFVFFAAVVKIPFLSNNLNLFRAPQTRGRGGGRGVGWVNGNPQREIQICEDLDRQWPSFRCFHRVQGLHAKGRALSWRLFPNQKETFNSHLCESLLVSID